MLTQTDLEQAGAVVYRVLSPTAQYRWPLLEEVVGCEVWVKHENHLPVGAFKVRGGLVFLDWLKREHPQVRGVIAATRGNHGQSVAYAARANGLQVRVYVPLGNSREKNAAMRALGAEVVEHGHDFQAAWEEAQRAAGASAWHLVPSFDPLLVKGVATYALELFGACPGLDTVYAPIGLGSGICGLMAVRDLLRLNTEIVGVVAEAAPAYALSFEAGRLIPTGTANTLIDGIACRQPDPAALNALWRGAARILRVSDTEARRAMRLLYQTTHNVAEPAGAAALAGLLQERECLRGKRAAIILTGANVDRELFIEALHEP
jgi:threonine dehydratase